MNPNETIIVSDSVAYGFGVSRVFYTDTIVSSGIKRHLF